MNNTNSTNHSKQLRTWAKIINDCKAAKASGTTVKDWLKANNISHDTYYYWYAEVKKAYVNDSLPEIVSVDNELTSCIKLSINDVSIEVNELTNPELLANVIKVMRDGINGLSAIIEQKYKMNVFIGKTLFMFCGHNAKIMKVFNTLYTIQDTC